MYVCLILNFIVTDTKHVVPMNLDSLAKRTERMKPNCSVKLQIKNTLQRRTLKEDNKHMTRPSLTGILISNCNLKCNKEEKSDRDFPLFVTHNNLKPNVHELFKYKFNLIKF